jgi:hypothetical protein
VPWSSRCSTIFSVPTITVDTADGYHPDLPELVRFLEY